MLYVCFGNANIENTQLHETFPSIPLGLMQDFAIKKEKESNHATQLTISAQMCPFLKSTYDSTLYPSWTHRITAVRKMVPVLDRHMPKYF